MRVAFLASIVAFFATTAHADSLFSDGGLTIIFHERECAVPQAGAVLVSMNLKTAPKAMSVTMNGQRIYGCWALDSDGDYVVIDSQGAGGAIYARHVKKMPNA